MTLSPYYKRSEGNIDDDFVRLFGRASLDSMALVMTPRAAIVKP